MSSKGKLRTAMFWIFLGAAQMMGAPINPKEIENILHVMNQQKVEVVIEKADPNSPLPFDSK
jgi:hypothetical protein